MPIAFSTDQPIMHALTLVADALEAEQPPPLPTLGELLLIGLVHAVPASSCATFVQSRRGNRTERIAATTTGAPAFDALQIRAKQGPLLDAIQGEEPVLAGDVTDDPRWPALAALMSASSPIKAAVCTPVRTAAFAGAVNLYSDQVDAFTDRAAVAAQAAAVAGRLVIVAAGSRLKAHNLAIALETNRQIGAAVGIIMSSRRCTYDDAVAQLVEHSQQTHRKLADLAATVLLTGMLPLHVQTD